MTKIKLLLWLYSLLERRQLAPRQLVPQQGVREHCSGCSTVGGHGALRHKSIETIAPDYLVRLGYVITDQRTSCHESVLLSDVFTQFCDPDSKENYLACVTGSWENASMSVPLSRHFSDRSVSVTFPENVATRVAMCSSENIGYRCAG